VAGSNLERGLDLMRVGRYRFEELVAQALDGLPRWVHRQLENVDVLIEDHPPSDDPELLGLYEGVPLTERDGAYFGVLPDRITLFRSALLNEAEDEDDLREIVQDTVIHEIAHFFGISDDRLREMDRY
jgi:predicted Zn-dependent protease with MMP-like domain